jgi:CYTH domain-containing protein
MEKDLHRLSGKKDSIFKFAGDTKLLVLAHSDVSTQEEFAKIQDWMRRKKNADESF